MRKWRGHRARGERAAAAAALGGLGARSVVQGGKPACPDDVVGSSSRKGHLHSSMSVVVQELYSGLPATLSTDRTSRSNPIRVLGTNPEASVFVRTSRHLPPGQQSTHGVKIRLSNYPERLDCMAKAYHPGLMDLLGKQPIAAGGIVEDDHTTSRNRTQQGSFHDYSRVGLGVAEAMVGVPVEDLVLFPVSMKEACSSKEKEPRLIQEGRDFPPCPSCLERADLLQNLEEDLAKVQVTPETLSDPMPETQGMKADGTTTRLFSQTGEGRSRVSTGVPLTKLRLCSDANTVMTKVTISGTNASLEPLSLAENPLVKEPREGKEECQRLVTCAPFSAAGLVFSCLQSGGNTFLGQDEGMSPIVNACQSAQQEKMNDSDATPKISFDACLANTSSETSDCLLKGDLEFGEILWEESAGVQAVCKVGQECEEVEFLDWASEPKKGENLSQTWSNAKAPSDSENGEAMDSWADHTYSCLSRRVVDVQKMAALQQNHTDKMQEGSHPKKPAALHVANCVHLESGTPLLHHIARLPKDECPVSLESGRIREKDCAINLCPCDGELKGKGMPWVEASGRSRASTESQPTSHDHLEPGSGVGRVNLLQMKPCGNPKSGLWSGFGATWLHVNSSSKVCLMTGEECSGPALFCEELSFAQPRDTDLEGPEFTNGLLRGDPSRARVTLAAQKASCLLHNKDELTSVSWDGGDCATMNDQQEHSIDVKWGDAEDTFADVGSTWNKAHHSSDLCLATETGGTISGEASHDVLEVRTLSNCEEGCGLGVSHTCAPGKHAFLPFVCGTRDPKACPACKESLDHLNGVGKALNAICPVRLSEPCVEAETQKTGGKDSFAESEGLPDRNRSGFTPLTKIQQESTAEGLSVLESVGVEIVEAVQTEEGSWGSELGGKHMWDQDLDETVFPELAKIVTDQSQEGNQIHPTFSSVNHLCHLKSSFPEQAEPLDSSLFKEDFCSVDQPSKAICQMEIQICGPPDDHLDCLALFNQRNTVLEAETFERSPFPLVFPEKQNVDPALQTVTHSTEESPEQTNSSQRVSTCLRKTQDVTLPASVLLLEKGAQETSQQNMASSSDKMASELTERQLKEDSEEMESFKPFPGCLESPPGPLKWNYLLKDQPCQGKEEDISSASKAVIRTPSDAVGENLFLKCNREQVSSPGQTHFQPSLPTFISVDDQKSTEEVRAESFQSKEVSRLACVNLSIQALQSPGSWLSQEDEPFASLSSKAPLSPKVEEHPSKTLLVMSEAFPAVFSFEAKMETCPPHVCFLEGTSKLDFLPEAKDLSGATEDIKRHEEKLSCPVQVLPRRNPPKILSRSLTFAFQDRTILEASTPCLRTGRRRWQAVEGGPKLVGDHKKLFKSRLGSYITATNVKAMQTFGLEGCPKATVEPLEVEQMVAPVGALHDAFSPQNRAKIMKMKTTGVLKWRILAPRNPAGSSSLGRILKLKDIGRQTSCTRSLVGCRENGALGSPFREPERPERSMDLLEMRHTEAKTLSLGFRTSVVRPSASKGCILPLSSMLSKPAGFSSRESRSTFEGSGRMKSMLLFRRRQPGKAPGKAHLSPSPGFLKNPSEMVPRHRAEPLDPVCSLRIKRTMIWNHMPKPRVSQSRRLDPFHLSKHTKDPKLFRKLSTLADKLLAPPHNPHKLRPLLRSSALLPVPEKYRHQRSPMLPEMFSCINIEFNSLWLHSSSSWFQMFSSQPVARGSVESTRMCFFGLDSKAPWVFGAPVVPISFRIQVDPSSTRNFLGQESLLNESKRLAVGEAPTGQTSGWTVSFLLSQSHLDVTPRQKDAPFPPAPAKARMADAMAQSNAHGLQTILALLSPGFCRLWRKRWHRAHRTLGVQTLMLLQLTRGLKGLKKPSPPVSAGLASSMPYALGKGLSLWSQQGLSTMTTSAFVPLPLLSAGSCCKWQPAPTASANLSLRNNSCAMLPPVCDQVIEASLAVKEEACFSLRWKLPFPRLVPRSCQVTELAQLRLGLSTPEFQIHCSDELNASPPALLLKSKKAHLEKRPQKVSQIRIRKTIPKPDPNLTPMGLPRPKRLKKTEFSLEEIYTNKNYKSPPATRCLETIFEEPKEKNGSLVAISHQKRKRVLEFQDFTIPRKRKARSRVKVAGSFTRAQKAALEGRELDVLLIQKLTDLETFFAEHEKGAAS